MKVPEIETLDDFTCFLMTYLAEADYRITPEEKDIILSHVTVDKYDRIKHFIDNRSDYQLLQLIDYYRDEFLKTPEDKQALIQELEMLFHADGRESVLERNMIMGLKKFIL